MTQQRDIVYQANGIKKYYPVKSFFKHVGEVKALDGVDVKLERGKTLAIVGES